jgi:glycosyltransferase involved in cell wall biosynthesis
VTAGPQPFSIVCLSQSPWDAPLPTNRQQIMRRAAERGHEVVFVETSPFLGRRLRGPFGPVARGGGVSTLTALNAAPRGHRYGLPNIINARLTSTLVRRVATRLPQPVVLWIYDPFTAGMVRHCGERFAVYDCVDDYGSLAFYTPAARALAARRDRESALASRLVFTTTTPLYERHKELNPETHLVPNVGDFEHFSAAADPGIQPPELAALPRPVVGFAGNFMPEKVDLELLAGLAAARPDWTLLLVGPAEESASAALESLARERPNVRWLGPVPYEELPRYVAAFDVGLCPNRWNDYGRSCFPLKVYEYLAAGKPVVASGNPDLAALAPDVTLARGVDELVAAVEDALGRRSDADRERRRSLAAANTWDSRTSRLLELVSQALV